MHCTQFFFQTKVVTNQKPQLLCYVTFFNILCHFGVIAAYGSHRESFVPSYGTDFSMSFGSLPEKLTHLHAYRSGATRLLVLVSQYFSLSVLFCSVPNVFLFLSLPVHVYADLSVIYSFWSILPIGILDFLRSSVREIGGNTWTYC